MHRSLPVISNLKPQERLFANNNNNNDNNKKIYTESAIRVKVLNNTKLMHVLRAIDFEIFNMKLTDYVRIGHAIMNGFVKDRTKKPTTLYAADMLVPSAIPPDLSTPD